MSRSLAARISNLQIGRMFRDYIVLSGGQIFSKLLGFFAFAYLARILTVAEFGAVETVVGMSLIGFKVIELGTGSIAVRRLSQGTGTTSDVLGAVISTRFLIAFMVVPILALAYSFMTGSDVPSMLIWLFALSLLAAPFSHEWLFQAHEKMAYAAFSPLLKMSVFLLAVFIFSPTAHGVAIIGLAEILAMAAVAAYFFIASKRTLHAGRPNYGVKPAVALFKESAPLGASTFFNSVGLYAPVLVVATVAGAEAAGLFGAAHRILASVITFSYVYYFNLLPLFSRLLHHNPEALQKLMNASMRVTAWAGISVCLGLWALGDPIMTIIFGANFASAAPAFKMLIWMGVFEVVSGNARWLLVAAHRQGSVLSAQIVGAVSAILLTFALAPSMGAYGAAIAVVIANGAIWAYAWFRTRDLSVHPPFLPVIRHMLAGAFAVIIISWLQPAPLVGAIIAGFVMLASAALDRQFISALKSLAAAKNALQPDSEDDIDAVKSFGDAK